MVYIRVPIEEERKNNRGTIFEEIKSKEFFFI